MGCMQYSANPWHIPWEHPFTNNIQANCTVKWGRKNPQDHEGGNLAKRGGGSLVREGPQLHPFEGENASYGYILLVPLQCALKYQCRFR